MEKIKVIVETAQHNYSAYLQDIDGIVATGATMEEIMESIKEAIDLSLEVSKEIGEPIPEKLKGEYELEFEMDVATLLNYFDGILGKPALEKITGINQKQLWHYASGKGKPRAAQREKINNGLHRLGKELLLMHI